MCESCNLYQVLCKVFYAVKCYFCTPENPKILLKHTTAAKINYFINAASDDGVGREKNLLKEKHTTILLWKRQ